MCARAGWGTPLYGTRIRRSMAPAHGPAASAAMFMDWCGSTISCVAVSASGSTLRTLALSSIGDWSGVLGRLQKGLMGLTLGSKCGRGASSFFWFINSGDFPFFIPAKRIMTIIISCNRGFLIACERRGMLI